MHGFHCAIWNSNTSVTAISVSTSTGKMWNLRSLWVTYLIVWASSHEPSWQHWSSYWGQFRLGFIWEISAWFPSWKKAKDPGDEFWHEIRETKQTWQNTKIITFASIIALVTLKAGITAVKWDASDAKSTAGNARRCHPGRQRSSRFHPGTRRAKVMFIYVTLHGISGNKVNARTRHVITRSHANGMTRLPCGYAHKNNWYWEACS